MFDIEIDNLRLVFKSALYSKNIFSPPNFAPSIRGRLLIEGALYWRVYGILRDKDICRLFLNVKPQHS